MRPFALLAILVLPAADEPGAAVQKAEVARHQGTWRVTSSVRDGKSGPGEVIKSIVRVVEGDHVVWKRDGKNFAGTTVVLDPSKAPKTIDVVPDGGPFRDKHVLGVYKLDGDLLTICMAGPDEDRPKTFDAPDGSGLTLMTFAREK